MKKKILGLFAMLVLLIACDINDDDGSVPATADLVLNINGLDDLGSGFAYEGWIMVSGTPVSTGTFTVDGSGTLSQTTFSIPETLVEDATKFILTIEPSPDTDPAPSDQKLIAGDFDGSSASLSTATAPAIGNFSNVAGSFFLRTPTDEAEGTENNGNDQYGVWFGMPGMPPVADLILPDLPAGWAYEGWVVGDNGPLSTGTFTSSDMMDMNAGEPGSFGGTERLGPPLPGEDFFNNAPMGETFPLDVRGRTVVISVEPVPDNSPMPFTLKPLAAMAGQDTAPASYSFGLNLDSFPTGTVSR